MDAQRLLRRSSRQMAHVSVIAFVDGKRAVEVAREQRCGVTGIKIRYRYVHARCEFENEVEGNVGR